MASGYVLSYIEQFLCCTLERLVHDATSSGLETSSSIVETHHLWWRGWYSRCLKRPLWSRDLSGGNINSSQKASTICQLYLFSVRIGSPCRSGDVSAAYRQTHGARLVYSLSWRNHHPSCLVLVMVPVIGYPGGFLIFLERRAIRSWFLNIMGMEPRLGLLSP